MHHLNRTIGRTAAAIILVILAATVPATATAMVADASVQSQINAQLAAAPGGVQINANEVAYGDGRFIITFARPAGATTDLSADCPSGWFCFYDEVNYGFPRGRLSDCGFQDLGDWGWRNRVESTYYNLDRGSVAYLDQANPSIVLFAVSVYMRGLSKVPYPNKADYVMRTC